jgi:hypothetical protein
MKKKETQNSHDLVPAPLNLHVNVHDVRLAGSDYLGRSAGEPQTPYCRSFLGSLIGTGNSPGAVSYSLTSSCDELFRTV